MKLKAFASAATAAAIGFVLCASAPVLAKGGGPKPKPTTPKPTTHGKPAGSVAPKGSVGAPKGGAPKGTAPKGGGHVSGASKGTAPKGNTPAHQGSLGGTAPGTHTGKAPKAKQGTGTPGAPGGLNQAQQHLTQNTNLRHKMEGRLPAGTDPVAAASGFRNLGQYVAAVNASHNQGYDFFQLKALMTGPNPLSLGQAKKQLRAGGSGSPGPDPVPTGPGAPPPGAPPAGPGAPPAGSPGADPVPPPAGPGAPPAGSPGADTVGGIGGAGAGASATAVPPKTKTRNKSHH